MSYLKKYYVAAEERINERRNRNKEIHRENIRIAEEKIPEIKELRKRLSAGGAKLSTILISGGDAKKKVREIAAENMEVNRRIRELLILNGYKDNFIDPVYSCGKCKDTGIYNNKRCSCFMNEVERLQCAELSRSSAMNLCSFEDFDLSLYPERTDENSNKSIRSIMTDIYSFCIGYARDFHLPQKGILMYGGTGLGKTHLSLAVGNEIIKGGYSVIYGSSPDLFRRIEKEHFGNAGDADTAQLLQDCDLLIMDDLGAEFESKFNQSALYNLLNTRMNTGKPVIVSTNCTISELQERYGGRILSRLLTMEVLPFCGDDIRMIKRFSD